MSEAHGGRANASEPGADGVRGRSPREKMSDAARSCELCEAARLTEWFYEDDECWIAECEACDVPMVVWRVHDPSPPDDVKGRLHARLAAVVAAHFDDDHYVDDNLRTIPHHYHAHARSRRGLGRGLRRRAD